MKKLTLLSTIFLISLTLVSCDTNQHSDNLFTEGGAPPIEEAKPLPPLMPDLPEDDHTGKAILDEEEESVHAGSRENSREERLKDFSAAGNTETEGDAENTGKAVRSGQAQSAPRQEDMAPPTPRFPTRSPAERMPLRQLPSQWRERKPLREREPSVEEEESPEDGIEEYNEEDAPNEEDGIEEDTNEEEGDEGDEPFPLDEAADDEEDNHEPPH